MGDIIYIGYDVINIVDVMSYPIYMISLILFHENKTTVPGISPTVFDITATASVWSHLLYQCLHIFFLSTSFFGRQPDFSVILPLCKYVKAF